MFQRLFAALIVVLLLSGGSAFAQTATATPTATPTNTPGDKQAKWIAELNRGGVPQKMNFGDTIMALWDGRQSGGAMTDATPATTPAATVDIAAWVARVHGVHLSGGATTANAITACGNTDGTHYKKCTLCVNQSGTLRFTPGVAATGAQANALKPACSDTETELGWIELPVSFTSNTTVVTAGMLKSPTPRGVGVTLSGKGL